MIELTELTISEAAAALAARSVSSAEVLEATLARIEETEPLVHAYAFVLADAARESARLADEEIAAGRRRGPLHGIPIGVKDLCYTAGAPTEAGSRALAGFVAPYDAAVVARLREAGAVIVGKTVTHEFAYGQNVPPTRNPWDPACYPGGSSAGSGVAVAARSAFGAIGTDTGGSIRVPASVNGVVGLKPTFGRVSRYGVMPMSSSLDHVGPLARTVEDTGLLLQAVAGYDPQDTTSADEPVPDFLAGLDGGARGVRLGAERNYYFYEHLAPEVRSAVERALEELSRLGAELVELRIPELELAVTVGLTILLPDTSAYHRRLLRERGGDYDPGTRLMLELGEFVPATHYVTAQRARTVLRDSVRRAFREHRLDALVGPTLPLTSVPVEQLSVALAAEDGETALSTFVHHCIPANVSGQPALSVPCGFSSAGLPIGLQLVGRPFDEATLFRVAHAYERAMPWHERRPEPALAATGRKDRA